MNWTKYAFADADDTLAHALRCFILGRLHPDDVARNHILNAETLILECLNGTNFPMAVLVDDSVYFIDRILGPGSGSIYLKNPIKLATCLAAGKSKDGVNP